MALALTEEHLALAESVRGWAGRAAPGEVIRAAVAADDGGGALYTGTLRPALARQGLLGVHVPEALGGQGYGLPELAVVVEELGRALLPGGFLPTVLTCALLLAADASALDGLVKGLATGTLTGAVGFGSGLRASGHADGSGSQPASLVIEGTCGPVPGAGLADLVIVPVAGDDRQLWVALDSADVKITPLDSLDLTRRPPWSARSTSACPPTGC